ncbi:MAG: hypothetical protein ACLR8Y_13565 [Alistipes indistinctus]
MADSVYRSEGYVGGAIFNEDFSVRQYISNAKSDLVKLRSSKYLQSNAEGFYYKVRDLVKSGEKSWLAAPLPDGGITGFSEKRL